MEEEAQLEPLEGLVLEVPFLDPLVDLQNQEEEAEEANHPLALKLSQLRNFLACMIPMYHIRDLQRKFLVGRMERLYLKLIFPGSMDRKEEEEEQFLHFSYLKKS